MTKSHALWWMTAIFLLVTGLIARSINADPIWYDEHRSFYYAGWDESGNIPLAQTIDRVRESDVQAPGYYTLLNLWGYPLGQSPFSGRVLSLLVGVLAVAAVYRAAADISTRQGAVAAALLIGTSAFFIVYAHEIRTYAMLVLFIGLALSSYVRLVGGRNQTVWVSVLLVISLAILPYLHYLASLMMVTLGLYHLLIYKNERQWWWVLGLIVLAGLLFVPWVLIALEATITRATETRSTVPTMDFPTIVLTIGAEFSNGNAAMLLLLLALAITSIRERRQRFVWLTTGIMLILIYVFDRLIPLLNHPRYLIVMWTFVAILAGFGVQRLARLGIPLVVVLAVWALPGVWRGLDRDYRLYANGPGAYAAWDFASGYLRERVQKDDLVALHLPFETIYDPYHQPIADYYFGDLDIDSTAIESRQFQPDEDYLRVGLSRVQDHDRVWYLRERDNVPQRFFVFDEAIGETLTHCGSILNNDEYLLDLYIEPPQRDDVTIQFGSGIAYVPYFRFDENESDFLYITGGWFVDEAVPPHTYSVALHMLNEVGELVAQADYGLPPGGAHCGYGMIDTSLLPLARYTITISVYAWESGEPLIGEILDSGERTERIPLGIIDRRSAQ